jgi:hypothetical protein
VRGRLGRELSPTFGLAVVSPVQGIQTILHIGDFSATTVERRERAPLGSRVRVCCPSTPPQEVARGKRREKLLASASSSFSASSNQRETAYQYVVGRCVLQPTLYPRCA